MLVCLFLLMMLSITLSIFMRPPILHIANPFLKFYMNSFPADFSIIGDDSNCYEYDSNKFGGNVSLTAYLTEFRNTFNLAMFGTKFIRARAICRGLIPIFESAHDWINFLFQNRFFSLFSCSILLCCFSDHEFVNLHINSAGVIPRGPGV